MRDQIRVEGIEFYGYHGVTSAEREVGHRFRAELRLELPLQAAGESDDLKQTVDYGAATRIALEVGTGPSVKLVETLAERMASRLLAEFPAVEAVEVSVTKLFPPAPLAFSAATICIRRQRSGADPKSKRLF